MSKKEEEKMFDGVELETPSNTDTSVKDVIAFDGPDRYSEGWDEYVMSLFSENEVVDGYPTSSGLRRVSQIVLGRIIESGPVNVMPPQDDNTVGRATVVWWVTFEDGTRFGDVADCSIYNTDDMFQVYAVATAATRAEARALRKALGLSKAASDELTSKNTAEIARDLQSKTSTGPTTGEYEGGDGMSDPQQNLIDIKSKQLSINTRKLFSEVFGISTKGRITKKQASAAIDKMNEYQRETIEIPDTIKGYEEDWRN